MSERLKAGEEAAAAATPKGGSRVHPSADGSFSARGRDDAAGARSPQAGGAGGKSKWSAVQQSMLGGASMRNPDRNTFRPNGHVTHTDLLEDEARKRDPLRGKKLKLASYTVLLAAFLATSIGARPTLDIYSQNAVLENLMVLRVDEDSGMKQQQLGIAWSFITTEEDFWMYLLEGLPGGLHGQDLRPGRDTAAVELLTGYRIKQVRVAATPCEVRPAASRPPVSPPRDSAVAADGRPPRIYVLPWDRRRSACPLHPLSASARRPHARAGVASRTPTRSCTHGRGCARPPGWTARRTRAPSGRMGSGCTARRRSSSARTTLCAARWATTRSAASS